MLQHEQKYQSKKQKMETSRRFVLHQGVTFKKMNNSTLFNGLYVDDAEQRRIAMDNLFSVVRSWVQVVGEHGTSDTDMISPATATSPNSRSPRSQPDPDYLRNVEKQLEYHVLVMLRMSINCPFEDVRLSFGDFLVELQRQGVTIPKPVHNSASYFIPVENLVKLERDSMNSPTRNVLEQAFLTTGRLSNVYRLMVYFPDYLERFMTTFNSILRLQGPLPRHWRNYIAIMASAQHQCQYLCNYQTKEFLMNGGDPDWLKGLQYAPEKLQNLANLNTLMAHQPWRVNSKTIAQLTKGTDNWSRSELVLAIVVLATFHSLSSFVLGCGIVPDSDMVGGVDTTGVEASQDVDEDADKDHTQQLMNRLQKKDEIDEPDVAAAEVFETLEAQETFTQQPESVSDHSQGLVSEQSYNVPLEDWSRFLGKKEVVHVDFDVKSPDYNVFRLQDYSWEEHGVSLVGKFLPELGEMLDSEFSAILNLTDYTVSNSKEKLDQKVDTWPFRQAIWYYVLRLGGMFHDDYNYHEVNVYLNKRIKQYIKKVACFPELIVPSDFHKMGFVFRPDEKCHINLLASEARKSVEILYALHAVMKDS